MRAYYVEPVGGHLGMHYYDFELCHEMKNKGIDVVLQTCDETKPFADSLTFEVRFPFKGIYGDRSKISRGFRYIQGLLKILFQAWANRIQVIHFHFYHFPPFDFFALKLTRLLGIKSVLTVHDVIPFDARPGDTPWLKRIYRNADAIVVHTRDSREEACHTFGVERQKVEVIPQGPYLKFSEQEKIGREEARSWLSLRPDAYVVLFFGQIKKVKGLDYLILAFRKLLDTVPDSRLVIAGPEWKDSFERYRSLIRQCGIEGKVVAHVKHIPSEDVGTYFAAADVLALPYIKVYQSAVLFMAHSFAKPIIATNIGGLAEVIRDGETGILVPPKDEDALAQALIRLHQDSDWARRLGEYGKKVAREEYSWTSIAEKMIQLYHSLVP